MTRQKRIKAGLRGHPELQTEVAARRDADDAPPWDLDTKFALVGTDIPRLDAVAKVTGAARYPSDARPKALLWGAILRSPLAAGQVLAIETGPARAMPGVAAVVEQVRGPAGGRAGTRIRYQGQELAAVAARTAQEARQALAKIRVEIEPETPRVDSYGDERKKLPEVDAPQSSLAELGPVAGDSATVTHLYRTQVQMHHPLEPHGITAHFRDDGVLEVWASTQGTFGMRRALAQAMRLPQDKVIVHTEYMGGGFGSKLGAGVEARLCAELARDAKRPVHLFCDRRGEALATGNRPASLQWIRATATKAGDITAWEARTVGFPGFGGRGGRVTQPSWLYAGLSRNRHKDAMTNTGQSRAFRAPGFPQGFFGAESMIDELAYRIGMSPLEFRLKNLRTEAHKAQLRLGAKEVGWDEVYNRSPGKGGRQQRVLSGCGMAIAFWGQQGRGGNQVACRIHSDGRVEVRNGCQDIGTGTRTVLGIVTAETLGIPLDHVEVHLGVTTDPAGPGSGGSTTAPSLAPTARHAAWQARHELVARIAEALQVDPGKVAVEGGEVRVEGGKKLTWKQACRYLVNAPAEGLGKRFANWRGWAGNVHGCQFAHVSVHLDTGRVDIHKIVAVQDCGTVIDKLTAESQVIGAVIQGIGYGLYEERIDDGRIGRVLTTDFETYRLPGSMEMPEIVPIVMDGNNGHTNTGVMGLGEPPTIPTSGAIANAIRNATGVRMMELPMNPARVHAAVAPVHGV